MAVFTIVIGTVVISVSLFELIMYIRYRYLKNKVKKKQWYNESKIIKSKSYPEWAYEYLKNISYNSLSNLMNEGFSYANTPKGQYYQEVKISELRKIHIRKFIGHIVYGKSLHHLTKENDEVINELISKMESTLDTKFLTNIENNDIYTAPISLVNP